MGWTANRLHVELHRARQRGFRTGHADQPNGRPAAGIRQSGKRRQTRRAT
jgi:hypothetical protein